MRKGYRRTTIWVPIEKYRRFKEDVKKRGLTICHTHEAFYDAWLEGILHVHERQLYIRAPILFQQVQYLEGKPRSKYKRKKREIKVYEYGDPHHCFECNRKSDYVIVSRPSEKEKVLTYYCRFHFDIKRRKQLQSLGRVGFLEL